MAYDFVHGVPEVELIRLYRRLKGLHGRNTPVAYVAVFGSRTKGTHRKDSDLDIVLALASGASDARKSERFKRITTEICRDFKDRNGIELDLSLHDIEEIGPNTKFGPSDLKRL